MKTACKLLQEDAQRTDAELAQEREQRQLLEAEIKALRRQMSESEASTSGGGAAGRVANPILNRALRDLQFELSKEAALNDQLMHKAELLLRGESLNGGGAEKGSPEAGENAGRGGIEREMQTIAEQVAARESANEALLTRVKELQTEIRCVPRNPVRALSTS